MEGSVTSTVMRARELTSSRRRRGSGRTWTCLWHATGWEQLQLSTTVGWCVSAEAPRGGWTACTLRKSHQLLQIKNATLFQLYIGMHYVCHIQHLNATRCLNHTDASTSTSTSSATGAAQENSSEYM